MWNKNIKMMKCEGISSSKIQLIHASSFSDWRTKQLTFSIAMFSFFLKGRTEKGRIHKEEMKSSKLAVIRHPFKCQTWSEIIVYMISDLWLAFRKLNLWRIYQKWYWSQLVFTKMTFTIKTMNICESFSVAAAKTVT